MKSFLSSEFCLFDNPKMTPLALLILKSNTFRIHVFPCHCLAKTSCHHITLLNLSSFVFLRYLAVQGGFPGHGVPRRGRWVLWFGWLLGSLGLILGEKNEWRNKEMKMPPLLQQARGATVLTYIYMTDTPSSSPVAYTNLHILTQQNASHRPKRSEIFFHPEREKALPE